MNSFKGKFIAGNWTLQINDFATYGVGGEQGRINEWAIDFGLDNLFSCAGVDFCSQRGVCISHNLCEVFVFFLKILDFVGINTISGIVQ